MHCPGRKKDLQHNLTAVWGENGKFGGIPLPKKMPRINAAGTGVTATKSTQL